MAVTRTHFPFRIDVRTATARALSIVDCADDCAALPVGFSASFLFAPKICLSLPSCMVALFAQTV